MQVEVRSVQPLSFDDGSPVRAASAVARLADGWLVAQDDATHAAWLREGSVTPVRLLPPVQGQDVFEEAAGTKHLKPDLEAACEVSVDNGNGVLLLGSGSKSARMRAVLVDANSGTPQAVVADLTPLYARVAAALAVSADDLNLEGACPLGDELRWFNRGVPAEKVPTGSVDLDLRALLDAVQGRASVEAVSIGNARRYELGDVEGVGLAITDAVRLSSDRILASAAAEDTSSAADDGTVAGSALVLIEDSTVAEVVVMPRLHDRVAKVEGLAVTAVKPDTVQLLAVVDADDPDAPSLALHLKVRWA